MSTTTKFNLGDVIWFMFGNQARNEQVTTIRVNIMGMPAPFPPGIQITYNWGPESKGISQEKCYATKEELLASL